MNKYILKLLFFLNVIIIAFILHFNAFGVNNNYSSSKIKVGADLYYNKLKDKNIAIVANHTSKIGTQSIIDTLKSRGIKIKKIFCPEHGFRGDADAGEKINNYVDKKTGIPVISLYGNNYKPKLTDLADIDIIVFDIQDVGVRFYTYISTMHYVMEACAENKIEFIVLDRPNPNGYYVDGPVLKKGFESFVGMHPVPWVHGMTVGEYAKMINGQGWLKNALKCNLTVIPIENYTHSTKYVLPIKPSPNLPNMTSVYLYPSLCIFEGTVISVARGTDFPFQAYGHPKLKATEFFFIPRSIKGAAKYPPYEKQKCFGFDLRNIDEAKLQNTKQINLDYLINAYKNFPDKSKFFNSLFDKLAGSKTLKNSIISGILENKIRESWANDIAEFKKIRKTYLLYPDFE